MGPGARPDPGPSAQGNEMAETVKGKVKFFNNAKAFGFIVRDDGQKDVFVHKTALNPGVVIQEGDRVSFELKKGKKGDEAANVSLA